MATIKIIPFKNGNQIARGVMNATLENLEERLNKALDRAKGAEMICLFNTENNEMIAEYMNENGHLIEKIAASALPQTIEDDIVEIEATEEAEVVDVVVEEIEEQIPEVEAVTEVVAEKVEEKKPRGESSKIILDMMLSGKPFTRNELYNALATNQPEKERSAILNTMGALMSVFARKHDLRKKIETVEIDGKKVKTFLFAKAA